MSAQTRPAGAVRRLTQRLARRHGNAGSPDGTLPLWDERYFGLERVGCFRSAPANRQVHVLAICARALLAEAWRIERSGIEYCARMTLAAEDPDERAMFALIGADEALHAAWLAPWIEADAPVAAPFNRYVARLAREGDPQPCAYLLQVVLEGFGIAHYGRLAAHCRDAQLAATFARMQRDEGLHHAGGLAAFQPARLTAADRAFLEEGAGAFLQMFRCGSQQVVAALDHAIGFADKAAVAAAFSELDTPTQSVAKLEQLRVLMVQPGMEWLVESLAQKGEFEPCAAAECARIYLASR